MRNRVKENFPMVLLTLLSIVQALALELLWSHIRETGYLFELSRTAVASWTQIGATFLGLVLIWVVYASSAMRFRWVPVTSDSVYPFLIGVLEFTLIEVLGPDQTGLWLILMAVIFASMVVVSHKTMKRARRDGDNETFFRNFAPATLRDFIPQTTIVCLLAAAGIYHLLDRAAAAFTLFSLLATTFVLLWQFLIAARFWRSSLSGE